MSASCNTVNLLRKCSVVLTSMTGHFAQTAFSNAPVLDQLFRVEVEQLCKDMNAHAEWLERDGVEQRTVAKHPTKAEGRAPRGATGSLKAEKTQGRKRLPTTAEILRTRGKRTTGGVPVEDEAELVSSDISPSGEKEKAGEDAKRKGNRGGAVPLTEDEKRRAAKVQEAKDAKASLFF